MSHLRRSRRRDTVSDLAIGAHDDLAPASANKTSVFLQSVHAVCDSIRPLTNSSGALSASRGAALCAGRRHVVAPSRSAAILPLNCSKVSDPLEGDDHIALGTAPAVDVELPGLRVHPPSAPSSMPLDSLKIGGTNSFFVLVSEIGGQRARVGRSGPPGPRSGPCHPLDPRRRRRVGAGHGRHQVVRHVREVGKVHLRPAES